MDVKVFDTVEYMILKELRRNDLTDLCESWGITVDNLKEYQKMAREKFEESEE